MFGGPHNQPFNTMHLRRYDWWIFGSTRMYHGGQSTNPPGLTYPPKRNTGLKRPPALFSGKPMGFQTAVIIRDPGYFWGGYGCLGWEGVGWLVYSCNIITHTDSPTLPTVVLLLMKRLNAVPSGAWKDSREPFGEVLAFDDGGGKGGWCWVVGCSKQVCI